MKGRWSPWLLLPGTATSLRIFVDNGLSPPASATVSFFMPPSHPPLSPHRYTIRSVLMICVHNLFRVFGWRKQWEFVIFYEKSNKVILKIAYFFVILLTTSLDPFLFRFSLFNCSLLFYNRKSFYIIFYFIDLKINDSF